MENAASTERFHVEPCWHVYPTYGKKHVTDGPPCWCEPDFERDEDTLIVIHHTEQ